MEVAGMNKTSVIVTTPQHSITHILSPTSCITLYDRCDEKVSVSDPHSMCLEIHQHSIIKPTHSSSQRRLAHEATARVLHLARSAAALGARSRHRPLILRSFSMVRHHASFPCPEVSN